MNQDENITLFGEFEPGLKPEERTPENLELLNQAIQKASKKPVSPSAILNQLIIDTAKQRKTD